MLSEDKRWKATPLGKVTDWHMHCHTSTDTLAPPKQRDTTEGAHADLRWRQKAAPLGKVTDWSRSSSKKGCVKACSAEYLRTGEYCSNLDTCTTTRA